MEFLLIINRFVQGMVTAMLIIYVHAIMDIMEVNVNHLLHVMDCLTTIHQFVLDMVIVSQIIPVHAIMDIMEVNVNTIL
jgi:hypothetical protein